MEFQKLTAIIRRSRLKNVEDALVKCGVGGLTVTGVKGYGEYANFFSRDWKVDHVKLQVFATVDEMDDFVHSIQEAAHTGLSGDGLIAVEPVTRVIRIRTGEMAGEGDLHEPCECPPAS
jgi:nitrogen regulatory protein P-II 1